MRIICTYQGNAKIVTPSASELVFGRADGKFQIGLDLAPDQKVSRLHGRIWFEGGKYWIEDLKSSRGTLLNGQQIKGQPKQLLHSNDEIYVGETTLRVEDLDSVADVAQTNYLADGRALLYSYQPSGHPHLRELTKLAAPSENAATPASGSRS